MSLDTESIPQDIQPSVLNQYQSFKLADGVGGYVYETPELKPVSFSKKACLANAMTLINNPFVSGIHYLASTLDSSRVNMLGAYIAKVAYLLYTHGHPRTSAGEMSRKRSIMSRPRFDFVSGSFRFYDTYMESYKVIGWPILAVLSGIDKQSSTNKIDMVRDIINILTLHNSTVVVCASGCTPHSLQYEMLRIKPSSYVNVVDNTLNKFIEL